MSHTPDPRHLLRRAATPFGWLMLAVVSWTTGIAITVLVFAIDPEAHSFIAAWFCEGRLSYSSYDNSLRPGETATVYAVYCADGSGARRDITVLVMVVVLPLVYACLSAITLMLAWRLWIRPKTQALATLVTSAPASRSPDATTDIASRLAQATKLLETGAITRQEYASIRADILSRLSGQTIPRRTR